MFLLPADLTYQYTVLVHKLALLSLLNGLALASQKLCMLGLLSLIARSYKFCNTMYRHPRRVTVKPGSKKPATPVGD
jgi:hypothetical protein